MPLPVTVHVTPSGFTLYVRPTDVFGSGVGTLVGTAVGVAGLGVAVGLAVAVACGAEVSCGTGVAVATGSSVGCAVALGSGVAVGSSVGVGVAVALGSSVADGVAVGVTWLELSGVGVAVGTASDVTDVLQAVRMSVRDNVKISSFFISNSLEAIGRLMCFAREMSCGREIHYFPTILQYVLNFSIYLILILVK